VYIISAILSFGYSVYLFITKFLNETKSEEEIIRFVLECVGCVFNSIFYIAFLLQNKKVKFPFKKISRSKRHLFTQADFG